MSLIDLLNKKSILPLESEALIGREEEIEVPEEHFVKGTPLKGPFPDNLKHGLFWVLGRCRWCVGRTSCAPRSRGIFALPHGGWRCSPGFTRV